MQVKTSPPKTDPAAAIFWRDRSGNLTREDPRQLTLDGLRVVEPVREFKTVRRAKQNWRHTHRKLPMRLCEAF